MDSTDTTVNDNYISLLKEAYGTDLTTDLTTFNSSNVVVNAIQGIEIDNQVYSITDRLYELERENEFLKGILKKNFPEEFI